MLAARAAARLRGLRSGWGGTCVFHMTWMRGWRSTRSAMTRLARKLSRRWSTVTDLAMRDMKSAVSMAVSPPPTTTTSFLR